MKAIPDYSAGTASVTIRPDARDFLRDLERKLRSMRDPNFAVRVEADVSEARRDTAAFRREESRNQLELDLGVDVAAAKAEVERFRKTEEGNEVDIPVDAETAGATAEMQRWRATQEANPINIKVIVRGQGTRQGAAQLGELEKRMESLRRSDLLRLNVGAGLLAGVGPALTGLAQVAASLQQITQLGLALPGVFAGAAASVGTLVLGLSGIKDAYDAVSDAATSSGKDAADQARAQRQASNQVRNSLVDVARAREDVARATRQEAQELRDLRIEQRGGMLDESRAILEAQKAREDLMRGNYSDIRDAQLRVLESDQRIIEVRERNRQTTERLNDANAKGVAGSDQVRDANERLARAQQQVADAEAAAADAAAKTSSAQDKAAEAMGKLGPNAQQLVNKLHELTPAFQEFRANISDPLLEGKAAEFENFFTRIRPVAERGLGGIAAGLNSNISALFGSFSSDRGQGIIDRILGNTGDAQQRFSAAISPLIEGLGTLTAAGTDVLPRLADGFASVMDRFRDFIVAADQDGRLDKWINDSIDGVRMLGESVLNIGKAFTAITQAAGGGKSFLQWLQDATGRLQTFLNSAEGQNKLAEYFARGREIIAELVPVLKELPGLFSSVGEGASLYIGGLLPILREVAKFLGDHPELVKAAVAAYLTWNTIKPIMGAVQNSINLLNTGLIGIGTNFAGTRARVDGEMSRVNKTFADAGKQNSGLGKFTSKVSGLAVAGGPFGILATTIATVAIPGLAALANSMDEAGERTDALKRRQEELEATLDRVTGKLTAQSLDKQLDAAQNFAPKGPGAGIKGISEGDALAAATALGITPEVYGKALLKDPAAMQQVRDVLIKNNLLPEFQANAKLSGTAGEIEKLTGGAINQDLLLRALIGDPEAVKTYTEELTKGAREAARGSREPEQVTQSTINRYNLANIAQRLSQTGQQSVLAGGAMEFLTAQMPTGIPTQQANQARFGSFRLSSQGAAVIGLPPGFEVNATGPTTSPDTAYKVTVPANTGLRMDDLDRRGITAKQNIDGSWELTIPNGSSLVEPGMPIPSGGGGGFKTGGPTPGPRNRGFLAELHGQEWVHDAPTVDFYGRDVMNALWRKQINPKAIKGLVPKFQGGGPTDPTDPNYIAIATGQNVGGAAPGPSMTTQHGAGGTPGPIAPNPFTADVGGQINNIASTAVSSAQNPINFGANLLNSFMPGMNLGQPGAAGGGQPQLIPGLWGLVQAGNNPALQQQWMAQTADWLVSDWLGGTVIGGLMNSVLPNVLNSVGLGGILNSPYMNAIGQTAGHFAGLAGQMRGALSGFVTLPDGSQLPVSTFLTPGAPNFAGDAANVPALNPAFLQQLYGGPGMPDVAVDPSAPGNGGLQINTLRGKQIIQQQFPWATNIGGVRADALKWHPSGLALDVMIPGAGGLNDPTPAAGKAMGDQMYAWLMANKDQLGIDYIMWQEKDHFNHLHINFKPSGYPNGQAPAPVTINPPSAPPSTPAPPVATAPPAAHAPGPKPAMAWGGSRVPSTGNSVLDKMIIPDLNDAGGWIPPGLSVHLNKTGKPEPVLDPPTHEAFKAVAREITRKPSQPRGPDARQKIPEPELLKPLPAPVEPAAPAVPPPVAAQPPAAKPPPPAGQAPTFTPDSGGVAPPGPTDYALPWVKQGISSGAAALGNIASTAASMAASAAVAGGSFGAAAPAAPLAGSIAGSLAGGAFQQGGKVLEGVANVISGALVGSVPGSFMTTPEAYGRTLRSEPNMPQTAMPPFSPRGAVVQYGPFYGHDTKSVMQEINLREAIQQQSALANYPGRI